MKCLFPKRHNQRGDTIVEVLISIAILAVVLAVALVSSGHSLESATVASNDDQALALAQQQLEIIKNSASDTVNNYVSQTKPFCIDNNGSVQDVSTGNCDNFNSQPYDVSITPASSADSTVASTLFTITVQSVSTDTTTPSSATLYYKLPDIADASQLPIVEDCTDSAGSSPSSQETLTGVINPGGGGTYDFSWGTTTSYSSGSSGTTSADYTSPTQVNASAGSLNANTTYYFQLVVTNKYGSSACTGTFQTS